VIRQPGTEVVVSWMTEKRIVHGARYLVSKKNRLSRKFLQEVSVSIFYVKEKRSRGQEVSMTRSQLYKKVMSSTRKTVEAASQLKPPVGEKPAEV
jgi:hypothetical protein